MTDPSPPTFQRRLSAPPSTAAGPSSETTAGEGDIVWFAETFTRLMANIGRAIKGKSDQVNLALIGLVSEGHILLEDAPGVGKTSLARAIAESISGSWHRVQFTPDLLPSDVTGISIWNQRELEFEFKAGPVFSNIVIGDEINRASPKTQSALLEVMEERQVTVDGEPHPVPRPFVVVATQNPVEMDGTYNLPEAQLDRFLLKMSMGYPDVAAECDIVLSRHGGPPPKLEPVISLEEITRMVAISASVRLDPQLVHYAVTLVSATRQMADLRLGASPRGSLGLLRAAQSLAAAEGRTYAIADDVKRLAIPVLSHRLLVAPDAQLRGVTADRIITDLLGSTAVPGGVEA
ncbi:MAG: AAA family ATPase [Acidimicrobiales bacterium]